MLFVIVMGVTGAGKSTIGRLLSRRLGWPFFDGDDYHPPVNVAKMASGQPLTDGDRAGWLDRLAQLVGQQCQQGQPAVLACSALKRSYRDQLRAAGQDVRFVYLQCQPDLLKQRLMERPDHFMPASLLDSQLATLETPHDALIVRAEESAAVLVDQIVVWLRRSEKHDGTDRG
jgi:gluconokinase